VSGAQEQSCAPFFYAAGGTVARAIRYRQRQEEIMSKASEDFDRLIAEVDAMKLDPKVRQIIELAKEIRAQLHERHLQRRRERAGRALTSDDG
jgi:hypothetical protein